MADPVTTDDASQLAQETGASPVERARAAGYTDDQINAFLGPKIAAAKAAGYTQEQINQYLGIKTPQPFDEQPMRDQIHANLGASPKPVTSFEDALSAGWQMSTAGLIARGKPPEKTLAADAPMTSRIANSLAMMGGDIPAMVGGFAIGGGMGAETGPGAAVTGMAGAMALPTALRQTLMDAYQKGQFHNFSDFWDRAAPIFIDTAKSYITGAATGAAGEVAAPAVQAVAPSISPTTAAIAKSGAEIATMTTVGKALEGQVPSAQDFMDAAVVLGGLKFAGAGAAKLRGIYAQTGVKPSEVVADAQRDVSVQQDLMAKDKPIPDVYAQRMAETQAQTQQAAAVSRETPEEPERPPSAPEPAGRLPLTGGGKPSPPPPPEQLEMPQPERPPSSPQEAEDRILSHMSVGEAPPKRPWSLQRVLANLYSDIYPIEAVSKRLGEGELPTADDPGRLASMMAGSGGITQRFVNHDTLDFNTGQPNGPGLKQILDSVPDKDMDGFRAFIAARHALNLDEQGIQTGFDLNAARMVVDNGARFAEVSDAFTGYLNRVSAYLRDAGVLSQQGYEAMTSQRPYYVPFQRVMDHLAGKGGAGGGREPFDPIKAMVGSQRMVIDPVESAIRNTALFVQMAERNVVGTKLVDLLLQHGEAERTELPAPPRVDLDALRAQGINTDPLESVIQAARPTEGAEVRIFRDGNAENYRVDPELATAMKGLDAQSANIVTKVLGPLSQTLRSGAVLQPDFMMRHAIRDYLYAFVTSPGGFSPWWMVRGIAAQMGKTDDYQNWLSSGAGRVSMISLDRQYLQHSIDELTGTGILDRAWNVLADPTASTPAKAGAVGRLPWEAAKKFLISPMQMGVELAENASHLGQFIRTTEAMRAEQPGEPLTKAQLLEAGFQSRNVAVDAGRIGAAMRVINSISAFANITVQDTARVIKAFADSPMSTALKVGIAISLPSVLTWMNGRDDSRYKQAPAWQRDLFWVVPTDRWVPATPKETIGLPADLVRNTPDGVMVNKGITWRIPKPWGMGLIFGSGVERLLDSFHDHAPHAFKDFMGSLYGVSLPNLLPNTAVPIVEQFANRSQFTNRTLIPDPQEKWLPEYQFTPYTTETAKALGRIVGALPGVQETSLGSGPGFGGVARALSSPILLENYLRAWTGNLGMYALETADYGLRKAGIVPDPPKPASTLADIPFIKAFTVRMPTSSAQSIQDFHDTYARNKTYFDTWQGMAKQGDVAAMQRIQAAGGTQMFVQLSGINTALGEQTKLIRDIYKNPQIAPEEKRQLIDSTYWRMTELARVGSQAMDRAINVAPSAAVH